MSQELLNVLGSEERVKEAVAHLLTLEGQTEETAIGHLEMLIKGQGQFNAALDGGLADKFPELLNANLEASKLSQSEQTTT